MIWVRFRTRARVSVITRGRGSGPRKWVMRVRASDGFRITCRVVHGRTWLHVGLIMVALTCRVVHVTLTCRVVHGRTHM